MMQNDTSNDPDGIRVVERDAGGGGKALQRGAAIVTLAAVAALAWWMPGGSGALQRDEPVPARSVDVPRAAPPPLAVPRPVRAADAGYEGEADAGRAGAPDEAGLVAAAEAELAAEQDPVRAAQRAAELLAQAVAAGATTGIAAFPPPGTNPIKLGLVVPKSFELPEGYVRHHQVTDDGRRLEPILMYSPDYEFVDANGEPVAVPEDGIVPEESAPEGLPLRRLAMPSNPYGPSKTIE